MGRENHTCSSDFILWGLLLFPNKPGFSALTPIVFLLAAAESTVRTLLTRRDPRLRTQCVPAQPSLCYGDLARQQHRSPNGRQLSFRQQSCPTRMLRLPAVSEPHAPGGHAPSLGGRALGPGCSLRHPLRLPAAHGCRVLAIWDRQRPEPPSSRPPRPLLRPKGHRSLSLGSPCRAEVPCEDTTRCERGVSTGGTISLLVPFSLVSAAYMQVLLTVLHIKSPEAGKKPFSTCSFHVAVATMY